MIVTPPAAPSRTLGRDADVSWRCLVRRGMLHSECESVDLVRLPAGARFAPPGTDGVESAWLVLRGDGVVLRGAADSASDANPTPDAASTSDPGPVPPAGGAVPSHGSGAGSAAVRAGDVVLVPAGGARLTAGDGGLDFLWVAVLPAAVSGALPPRVPVAS